MADFDTAEIEMWEKVYAVLRNDAPLIALMPDGTGKSRVRDINNLPTGYTMPYVALGDHERISGRTFGKDGQKLTFSLDFWADYHGRLTVLQINNLIYKALPEDTFTTANFRFLGGFTPEQGLLQSDNSTGVQLVHYIASYSAIAQRL